jgi:hypothetical protein
MSIQEEANKILNNKRPVYWGLEVLDYGLPLDRVGDLVLPEEIAIRRAHIKEVVCYNLTDTGEAYLESLNRALNLGLELTQESIQNRVTIGVGFGYFDAKKNTFLPTRAILSLDRIYGIL